MASYTNISLLIISQSIHRRIAVSSIVRHPLSGELYHVIIAESSE